MLHHFSEYLQRLQLELLVSSHRSDEADVCSDQQCMAAMMVQSAEKSLCRSRLINKKERCSSKLCGDNVVLATDRMNGGIRELTIVAADVQLNT